MPDSNIKRRNLVDQGALLLYKLAGYKVQNVKEVNDLNIWTLLPHSVDGGQQATFSALLGIDSPVQHLSPASTGLNTGTRTGFQRKNV